MKKNCILICILSVILLFTSGCGDNEKKGNFSVFYINSEGNGLESVKEYIDVSASNAQGTINLLMNYLESGDSEKEHIGIFPDGVEEKTAPVLRNGEVVINFNSNYASLDPKEQMLIEAAIVKTLVQVDGCDLVSFKVDNMPLIYSDGTVVGSLDEKSFVDNPGEQISTTLKATIKLYFANKKGTGLVDENRVVYYNSSMPLEKKVMEQLISGPLSDDLKATIPSGTNVITINVVDRICYVNLDEMFRNNQNNEIPEEVVLYSVVNSLTSIDGIDQVQIQINGNTSGKFRYNYDLSELYEMNQSLVADEKNEIESAEE